MAVYLALKETWHSRGRFLLIASVVALITVLVLFIAGLSQGLAAANREYIEKLDGELLVFQEGIQLSTTASRIGRERLAAIRRVEGVVDVGPVGFASGKLVPGEGVPEIDAALIGVEPNKPGGPAVLAGQNLERTSSNEVIVDTGITSRMDVAIGDSIRVKVTQGTDDVFFDLTVVGITDRRQYFFQPALFVPFLTWDTIRPQPAEGIGQGELVSNVAVVKAANPADLATLAGRIERSVKQVEVVDRQTAWEALPGYAAQQNTLNTQQFFTFFIGILVVGGFFQIQTLQKVAQIGMLKAIGASNWTVGIAAVTQIVTVNAIGVAVGAAGTLLLSLTFPGNVPIAFSGTAVAMAVAALLVIGPIGGLVSVWVLLRIEPLTALGLAQ
ncbi:MAG: ABC transporter permease [Caldilineaceae bacterium]|nr:ABC transporter permease [Caldilineaceae bacterium]